MDRNLTFDSDAAQNTNMYSVYIWYLYLVSET